MQDYDNTKLPSLHATELPFLCMKTIKSVSITDLWSSSLQHTSNSETTTTEFRSIQANLKAQILVAACISSYQSKSSMSALTLVSVSCILMAKKQKTLQQNLFPSLKLDRILLVYEFNLRRLTKIPAKARFEKSIYLIPLLWAVTDGLGRICRFSSRCNPFSLQWTFKQLTGIGLNLNPQQTGSVQMTRILWQKILVYTSRKPHCMYQIIFHLEKKYIPIYFQLLDILQINSKELFEEPHGKLPQVREFILVSFNSLLKSLS